MLFIFLFSLGGAAVLSFWMTRHVIQEVKLNYIKRNHIWCNVKSSGGGAAVSGGVFPSFFWMLMSFFFFGELSGPLLLWPTVPELWWPCRRPCPLLPAADPPPRPSRDIRATAAFPSFFGVCRSPLWVVPRSVFFSENIMNETSEIHRRN